MTATHHTPSDIVTARDTWSTAPVVHIDTYLYYENHDATHLVEIREHQFRQGWEYDVSVRKINGYGQNLNVTEKYGCETTLFEIRTDTEDSATRIAAAAMTHLERTDEFTEDDFKAYLSEVLE